MHDHAAGLAGADHVRLLALGLGLFLGAGPVVGVLERGKAPFADQFLAADGRRHFGLDPRLRCGPGDEPKLTRLMPPPQAASNIASAEITDRLATLARSPN